MKESICEKLVQIFPLTSDFKDLYSTYIANCVFNIFLTHTAIMLNIITMYAIRKTSSLPKTLKTLLLSLAVSDVGVGLFVHPVYSSLLVNWLQQSNPSCKEYILFKILGFFFAAASFLGVFVLSFDRFLAVHLHLRYQELVTHKRVTTVVISFWILSAFVSLLTLWGGPDVISIIISVAGVICLLLTAVIYIRIYLTARRHKNQMQSLQVQQTVEIANFVGVIKSTVGIFYVYLVFMVCYLPTFISLAAMKMNRPSIAMNRFHLFSLTLTFINSSLNPVIYCWKMRHIRHAIMDMLRNMSWNRNRASH